MAGNIWNRRSFVGALAAAAGLVAAGCKPSVTKQAQEAQKTPGEAPASSPTSAPTVAAMTVYRDPGCGCCEQWAKLARQAGFEVTLSDRNDMEAIKWKFGVPAALASCHTAVTGDYVVEGHVPIEAVKAVLRDRPPGVRGLAVPGMPRGAPGMEMPDGAKDPFQVLQFDRAGTVTAFRA